ncbi:MAG: hypothetical protein RIB45_00490 [Marivibrio sp.]|uniref:hypothetical protein n=1 Tax=Marivibrio sp. TaxID=2039719 RepID=UPI0032EAD466
MSDPNVFPAGPRGPDSWPPAVARRPDPGTAPRAEAQAGGARAPGRDPFDVQGAMTRLKTLLAFDGPNGPRAQVPSRGFYLNILT